LSHHGLNSKTIFASEIGNKGLFLFHPIDMEQSFKPTDELVQFMKRAKRMETTLFQRRHNGTKN
jgi:hypothetical protein